MRICILTHTFPRSVDDVAAPFMDGVAEGIRSTGNEVVVLTPYSPKFKRKKTDQKYKIITYKYIWPDFLHKVGYSETLSNDMSLKPLMFLLSPFMHFFGIIALFKLVKKEKIDLINAHWILPNGFIASVVSVFTGIPVVSTLPGSDVYMAQKNKFFGWMARFATRTSKWVTSNSPQLLNDLAEISEKNISKRKDLFKKFSTIIYGVFPNKFTPSEKESKKIKIQLGLSKNDLIILGVGRMVAKKGFKYLINASKTIIKKIPTAKFVLIGEGDQRKELEKLVQKLGLKDNFFFLGWVDYKNLVNYYNLADVFVLPSVRDEKGNLDDQSVSVVEAMSCGAPIVTTNFPGYKIVVKEGKNGFLVPEKKSDLIAKALVTILGSKAKRLQMSKNSRYMAIHNFSWPAIGKEYVRLFKSLLNEK